MDQPPKPSFFFAPLDSPVGGPIALGSLISKPKTAADPLNRKPITVTDDEIQKPPPRTEYHIKTGKTRGGSAGLWADFLGPILGVGGNATVELKHTSESDISCDLLETRTFRPSTEYLQKSVDDTDVKNWMGQHRPWIKGSQKIYMITGIKIAHNAAIAYKLIKDRGIQFHFGVDGTNSGVPLSLGPEANLRNDGSREESFKIVDPFVMAYRINEVAVEVKTGKVVSNEPYVKGTALTTVKGDDGETFEVLANLVDQSASVSDVETEKPGVELEDENGTLCHFAHS